MASRAAVVTLCVFLSSCIGYRRTKLPAYVVNGTLGGVGIISIAATVTKPSGDNGTVQALLIFRGLGLIAIALIGSGITALMPGPEKKTIAPLPPTLESTPKPATPGQDLRQHFLLSQ